jgi:hypothetical protein
MQHTDHSIIHTFWGICISSLTREMKKYESQKVVCPKCDHEHKTPFRNPRAENTELQAIYNEEPLLKGEIRLIVIAPGAFNDEIACLIQTTSLDSRKYYVALSYTWSYPKGEGHIVVNNVRVTVRKSLENALRYMRLPDKPITVWADGISINQNDMGEKSIQLSIMGNPPHRPPIKTGGVIQNPYRIILNERNFYVYWIR